VNWDQIAGQWKQLKGKAKEEWGKLTEMTRSISRPANAINSWARSNRNTVSLRTRPNGKSTSGPEISTNKQKIGPSRRIAGL
jgi:hypothetical protein